MFGFSLPSVVAIVFVVAFGLGGASAWKVQNWRYEAKQAAELKELQKLNNKRETVTAAITSKQAEVQEKVRYVTRVQIKEVDKYVSVSDCPLSGNFRVFHDAAAEGKIPDPASRANAPAATTREVTTTVADNYGICRETAERLKGLQEWVTEQQKLQDAVKSP